MTWTLFLDDIRFPVDETWQIARSVDEAMALIKSQGYPIEMSLDHDLGDDVPTGHDFVKLLIEQALTEGTEADLVAIDMGVHSANPVGKLNINGLWKSFQQHCEHNS
jgi:hypothetical protein